jgi:hypothetical protein
MLAELVWPVPGGHIKELFSPGRREQGQFVGADVAGGRLPPVPRKVVVPPVPGVTLMIPPVPRKVVVPPVPGVTLTIPPVPSVVLPRAFPPPPPLAKTPALPPDPIGKVLTTTLPPIPLLTYPGGTRSVRPHPVDHAPPTTKKREMPKPMYLESLLSTAAEFFKRAAFWTSGQQGQGPDNHKIPNRAPCEVDVEGGSELRREHGLATLAGEVFGAAVEP